MGLFNRASRHSGGHGHGQGPATEGRESSADADLGAELAELGEVVPEREPSPASPEPVAAVPEPAWRTGRGAFLQGLLARPALYATATMRRRAEAAARRNLARELADLDGP